MQNQLKDVKDKKAGWSSYCKYTKTHRAEIGRYAANHGVTNAVRKWKQRFPLLNNNVYAILSVST